MIELLARLFIRGRDTLAPSALLIGLVTFCLSLAGGLLGRRIGQHWSRPAGIAAGLVLLGLGVKILLG